MELASIAGVSFCASMMSSAEGNDSPSLEDVYEDLSRRHLVVRWIGTESLPNGSATERYEFLHALYRQVLYDRQLPARRAISHRQIGECLAMLYSRRKEDVAPELAYHFEQAADWPRAIEFLRMAADTAGRRYAHRQADAILARALELSGRLSEAERAHTEPRLLATLAAHRVAIFDLRAIETFETLAARAADFGLIDVEVRALLDLSFFLSHTSAARCLEVAQRALQLSAEQDPAMRIRTHAACAFRRLSASGWNAQDALEFRAGLAERGQGQSLRILDSELLEDSQFRWHCAEYREGHRLALAIRAKGLEPGANLIEYERAAFLVALNLFFLGEWGEALNEFATAIAEAGKNANEPRTQWLRGQRAWLLLHALDFRGVLQICDTTLALLRDPAFRTVTNRPIGYSGQLRRALILSGSASTAVGEYGRALEELSAATSEMDREPVFLDWYWRMPLAAGMTELWLATGERVRARQEAERLLELALATADRTWQGLGWEICARAALANRDVARARDCIGNAVATVEGFDVPLAVWQVHATAADIARKSGNLQAAHSHRDRSRVTILALANSLREQAPQRETFLSAPAVARILNFD